MDKVTNKIDNMAVVIAAWVLRHRWLIIFLSIVTIVMLASGMRYLTISTNYRIFFSEENPELSAFEDFQSTYTKNDNILFVVKPADGKVFTPATAQAVETLTEKAWQIPYVLRVDSVSNFQHSRARGDTIEVDRLYRNGGQLSQQDLDEKEQAALAEPLLKDNLISADALSTGINVTIQYPEKSIAEVPETARHARRIRDEIAAQYPDLTIAISGIAMLNNAFGEASTTDMGTLVPLMYVFLVVVMVVALRSISACLSTLLVVILATLAAMGVAGFARIAMTPISFIAPTIIMTLAVADCIHFLVTMIDSMRKGDNKADAIAESIKVNLIPISITSLTTAIGFISLNFSDSPPFGHLGNIAGVGIVAAWVLSLTFLPALVSVLPVRVKPHRQTGMLQVQLERWAFWVCRHSRKVLLVTGGITVALALQIPKLELNDDFIRYFDRDIEFRTDTEFAIENLNGIYLVEYSVGSGSAQGIHSRRYLQPLQDFTLWLKQQPEVRHVFSYTDIIKRLNKNMHADDPAHYRLPDNNLMAAQLLFLYENSLPAGNNLSDRVNLDKSATRVTVAIDDMTSKEGIEFFRRSEQWLQDNAPREMWATPTSVSVMFSYISQRNIESMLTGNAFALIIIAVVLMIVLRSVPLGALSLIPNLAPILAMYGIWALIVGQVGMAAATVSATSLGIVVDDTVHFLAKYLRARRQLQLQPPEAIRYAFKSVGVAIVLTTVVLAMGFSVLTLSSFLINSQMGLLTSLTIVLALVLDFLLLPALLLIGYHNKEKKLMYLFTLLKQPDAVRTSLCLIFLFSICLSAGKPQAQDDAAQKGYGIAALSDRSDRGFSDSKVRMTMVLRNPSGGESVRKLRQHTLEYPNEDTGDRTLIVFEKPADINGTALLSHSYILDTDDQWLYLPAFKRVKRISSVNKDGAFVGSEFSYEDFTALELNKFNYLYLKEQPCGKFLCDLVERTPKYKHSGYSKQVAWIDRDVHQVRRVDFFDRRGDLIKTLELSDYRQYRNKYWRAHKLSMLNTKTHRSTDLLFSDYDFKTGLTEKDFVKNVLTRIR